MDLKAIRKKVLGEEFDLSEHAHKKRQQEQITIKEITETLLKGDIIEKYPKDPRGESCLIGCEISDHALHVVCGFRNMRLLVVTVYRPKFPTWKDYKTRVKELKSRV